MRRYLYAIFLAFLLLLTISTANAYAPQGLSMSEQKVSNQFDPDGTVSKVEYYNGSVLIGTATTAPFSFTWSSVPNGSYFIRAKATDNVGATASATIKVIVGNGETITYLHNDFAGSPLAATDTAGNIVWKENYRPFGERLNNQAESADNRQWFHGKAVDADTGLQYFGARYYDPVLGRFMGVDPVGFQEDNIHSFNKYAYGNNNPYRFIDPDGKQAVGVDVLNGYVGQQWAQTQQFVVDGYIKSMNAASQAYIAIGSMAIGPEVILGRVLGFVGKETVGAAKAYAEIGTISTRVTANETRLGGVAGELGVKIEYKNGTVFDMTRTRVKEIELNSKSPTGLGKKKYGDDAINKQGDKRAPTESEIKWFDGISKN